MLILLLFVAITHTSVGARYIPEAWTENILIKYYIHTEYVPILKFEREKKFIPSKLVNNKSVCWNSDLIWMRQRPCWMWTQLDKLVDRTETACIRLKNKQ